jgi:hypothetical protein
VDAVPFLKALLWQLLVPLRTPGENPRSPDRVAPLLRDLLEDATLVGVLTSCGSPWFGWRRSPFLDKACFVFCTHDVSRQVLPRCSSPVCELCWSIPGGGQLLVASATVVLSRRLRWLSVHLCRVCTGSTTYPTLCLLFLYVDCNTRAGCSRSVRCNLVWPFCMCVCCIYFNVKGVINLTSGL